LAVAGVVIDVGPSGADRVDGSTEFDDAPVDTAPVPTFFPSASWIVMALAAARPPPATNPSPRTDAAPTAVHLRFMSMIFSFALFRGRSREIYGKNHSSARV
jgi:hypothetical protein